MNIAAILTCHNRKEKTLKCLQHLFQAVEHFNAANKHKANEIVIKVFVTDDACTDGTPELLDETFKAQEVVIVKGDGNCYWAGGMILAWEEALKEKNKWEYYLLLNDDTYMFDNCFNLLIEAREHSIKYYGKEGIYSGITCDTEHKELTTYGGSVCSSYFLGHTRLLTPNGLPQACDMANANIMLVHHSVVERTGIFWDGFDHGAADYDYSMTAIEKGFPVLVTANHCGFCDYDHHDHKEEKRKLLNMSIEERKKFYNNPLNSYKDKLRVVKRHSPLRYPIALMGCLIKIYAPKIYCCLSDIKDHGYSNAPKLH